MTIGYTNRTNRCWRSPPAPVSYRSGAALDD